jgi:RHH-type proline utilization regulon transcriptional repressor/proline dehydrogenase/delta 1-pyrroline-5-carboxylate dehydrogenase
MNTEGKFIAEVPLPKEAQYGSFFAPRAYEIPRLSLLEKEVFGPILHIIRYNSDQLDQVINDINATGYGLTLGIQTRIRSTADYILQRVHVGNRYINRNMIGAVVGVQPFGGEGLSGTGPKAGGPHYLPRLCVERTVTENTTAAGGNASLMMLGE